MKKKLLTIRLQLIVGFLLVLAFVVGLGMVSFLQTRQLYEREKSLYEHPLQVKEATDSISMDILTSRVAVRDYVIFDDENTRQTAKHELDLSLGDIEKQFEIIYSLYLGPISDVDAAYQTFSKWKVATQNRLAEAQTGNLELVIESLGDGGEVGKLRIELTANIKTIDDFADNKAIELNHGFVDYYQSLVTSSTILITVIVVLSVFISLYLIESIRKPLDELNRQIGNFREGDLSARSHYERNNEFGALTGSFNAMADAIQLNLDLKEKASSISDAMQRYEDQEAFFRTMLVELSKEFHANTAAVYLLNKNKRTYDCYDSIGLSAGARESFDALAPEGEFGMVLSTRKTQYICSLQENSKVRFYTSGGELTPNEIITIPIVSGEEVIAVISMTSMNRFFEHADWLIENIVATISARIEGVLAFQTIRDILMKLERQNQELDAQKNELTSQADELMQQNVELDMQSSQLAEASKLKTTFLSNMSHELRTPLNSIIALSGVLTRRLTSRIPEEELSYLEIVERNGKHLLSLINDILDISRIEAGREEIELTSFGLSALVSDIMLMLEPLAKQKGIQLEWQGPHEDVGFISDERKCRHILQNIISNAVKFTETGLVKVSAQTQGNLIRISVTDTGIGIAKENLDSIFNEFQQADGSTSRKYGGSGLGLTIARKYTELLGGSIYVTSALGVGSTFTISLPIHYQSDAGDARTVRLPNIAEREKKQAATDTNASITGRTLLIIEDSEPAIIQIKDLFERSGHKILIARSAREAFRIVEETVPDAIILDLMMPDIDGFETLNELRAAERTANVPVLILTAKHITNEELGRLSRNHISQVIQKGGINGEDFLAAVMRMFADDSGPKQEVLQSGPQPRADSKSRRDKPNRQKPLILVVEDNEDNRTTVRALLADEFQVIEAETGELGVELAKTRMPDLVLMDIALPGISGIDAFHAIRSGASTCRIPIIALTASAMVQERSSILAHGFDAFVAKPIQLEELLKAIGVVLYDR